MRQSRLIMGMPITVEVVSDSSRAEDAINKVFKYFTAVDERFSTYKYTSEVMQINRKEIQKQQWSKEMQEVFSLAQKTHQETGGYFNIQRPDGSIDPSGVVKGWAIRNAADLLRNLGYRDFFIDAGGDIQSSGHNNQENPWSVGIRNPFQTEEIVKVLYPRGHGVATSGTYVRGQHIYNPHAPTEAILDPVSLTIIGPDVCEADRFATGAFAMGKQGMMFIESLKGFEGYSIDTEGIATMTSGFEAYTTL